jgi:hypothetical protein
MKLPRYTCAKHPGLHRKGFTRMVDGARVTLTYGDHGALERVEIEKAEHDQCVCNICGGKAKVEWPR